MLRFLLLGEPLNEDRDIDERDRVLSEHVVGISNRLRKTYGESSEATREAAREVERLAYLGPPTQETVVCKLAVVLFALKREPEVAAFFKETDPELTHDLTTRVLPFLDPNFLNGSCQAPEAHVTMAIVFSQMFAGERLGNWA